MYVIFRPKTPQEFLGLEMKMEKKKKKKVRNEMEFKMTFPWQSTHKPRNLELKE